MYRYFGGKEQSTLRALRPFFKTASQQLIILKQGRFNLNKSEPLVNCRR